MSQFVQYISSFIDRGCDHSKPMFPAQLTGDMASYLLTLSPVQQLRFAVDQSLCVSYLAWLNGPRASEFLVTYAEWLKCFIDTKLATYKFDSVYQEVYEDCVKISSTWFGGRWEDVNIGAINVLVYQPLYKDTELPLALTKSSAIPYMMYRNRSVQPGFDDWHDKFSIPTGIRVNYLSKNISLFGRCIGNGFAAKIEDNASDVENARTSWINSGFHILDFLYHVDMSGCDFGYILSVLAGLVFTEDPYRELSRNHSLFYVTNMILNSEFSVDFMDIVRGGHVFVLDKPASKSYRTSGIARSLMTFLAALNKRYGVQMRARDIFVRFFGRIAEERSDEKKVVEYVEKTGNNQVASAESLMAYEKHMLGSCEAIDLISQEPTIVSKESGAENTEEEPEDNDNVNFDLDSIPGIDDAEPGLEAEDDSADADTSTDTDESSDDPSSGPSDTIEEEGTDNSGGNEDQGNDNSDAGTEDPGGSADQNAPGNSTQPNAEPENLDDSDEEGIPFSVVPEGSETVGSVLFREELDQFLSDVLTNPPKKLSPQSVSALTTLQRNWIHILSVETIVRILDKLITLPERFKNIPN